MLRFFLFCCNNTQIDTQINRLREVTYRHTHTHTYSQVDEQIKNMKSQVKRIHQA